MENETIFKLHGIIFKFNDEIFMSLYDNKSKNFTENTIGLLNVKFDINDNQMFLCEVLVKDGTTPIIIENVTDFSNKKHESICYFYDVDILKVCDYPNITIKEIIEDGEFLYECLDFYNECIDENLITK